MSFELFEEINMVSFGITYTSDPLPTPENASAGSFVDAATTPEVYTTCLDSLLSANTDAVLANCGVPFMAAGLAAAGLLLLRRIL